MQLKKVVNHNNTRWRVSAYVERKRVQRFFASKKLALEWMRGVKVDEDCVHFWPALSTEDQQDIISAYKLATSKGLSLFHCLLQSPAQLALEPITVSDAVLAYQAVIKQKALRPTSLRQTQRFLGYLADEFGNTPAHCVSASLLEEWFQTRNWQRSTIDGVIAKIGPFFSWLHREGYVEKSPCRAIQRPIRDDSKPPVILSAEDAHRLLQVALKLDPEFARYFAIGLFAGVRPYEIDRLKPKDISEQYIEITAANAKCRKRRLVTIEPNLKAWLQVSSKTPTKNKRRRKLALTNAANIGWYTDVMRHSFASYHLAFHESADKTALEMGHRDTRMLFRHYRELVTREEAVEFWKIYP